MSLQIWLPLNGNFKNNGLLNLNTPAAGEFFTTGGKTGEKCLKGRAQANFDLTAANISTHAMSFSFWARSDTNPDTSTRWWDLMKFTCNDGTDFHVYCVPNVRYKIEYKPELNTYCDTTLWHHLTYVLNKTNLTVYVDGVQISSVSVTNSQRILSTLTLGNTDSVQINDFRLYNHIISIQEMERDYSSLLIHYPLRDSYIENTQNLLLYPSYRSKASLGWDSNLHPNAILVNNWSHGYNSGVTNPTIGYHACWEMIDNIPTMVMRDYNKQFSNSYRWLGISSNQNNSANLISQIGPGGTYTVSFEACSDVVNKPVRVGLYYRITGSSKPAFHEGTPSFPLTSSWKRYSFTRTLSSKADASLHTGQLYVYGNDDQKKIEGTIYVRNLQIEIKNHATGYVATSRADEQIYDCSGRGHHSVSRGNLTLCADSARNKSSIEFLSNNAIKIPSPYGNKTTAIDDFSIAFWVYLNDEDSAYRTAFVTNYGNNTGNAAGWLSFNTEGKGLWFYSASTYFGYGNPLSKKTWYHVVLTFNKGVATWYLNGKQYGQVSRDVININASPYFGLGDSFTGTSWNGAPFNGRFSDFRFYGTTLSASFISDLYTNSATIDKNGSLHAYEYEEE